MEKKVADVLMPETQQPIMVNMFTFVERWEYISGQATSMQLSL